MHAVFLYLLRAHRLKSAGADVQRNINTLHPALLQGRKYGLIEMQTCGRRRNSSRCTGVHGLIALLIGSFGLFFTMFLLFIRFLPVIAAAEVKSVLPAADPHHDAHHHDDLAHEVTRVSAHLAPKGAH